MKPLFWAFISGAVFAIGARDVARHPDLFHAIITVYWTACALGTAVAYQQEIM